MVPLDIDKLPYANADDISLMQSVFNKFDKDGGGSIDVHEVLPRADLLADCCR